MIRALVAVLLLGWCAPLLAADDKAAARDAYESGRRHYDLGEYPEALGEFKRAYLHYPEPVFLFNIAICYRQLGDNKAAVRSYRAFLDNFPKAPNRAAVERMIAELEAQPATGAPPPRTPPAPVTATAKSEPAPRKPATVAMTTPRHDAPPPPEHVTTPPPTTTTQATPPSPSKPAVAPAPERHVSRADVTEMEEITPNFEVRSGSQPRKKVKPWVWGVTGVCVALAVGGMVTLVVLETRTPPMTTVQSAFTPSLPDFNAAHVPSLRVSF